MQRRLGLLFFALGTVGIGVPLLPTVPFWILAAIFLARAEPTLQQKIYDHPQFGHIVRQFVEEGVLSRRSKVVAIGGAGAATTLSLWITQPPAYVLWAVVAMMAGVFVWLATRPEPEMTKEDP